MNNSELKNLVRDTLQGDDWRRPAIEKLVANLAIEELYRLVRDTSVTGSWRDYALDAICEMATWSKQSVSVSSLELSVGGRRVSINTTAISLGIPLIAQRATDNLFEIVNDTSQPTRSREQCLNYLPGHHRAQALPGNHIQRHLVPGPLARTNHAGIATPIGNELQ